MNYVDRFLGTSKVDKSHLQLLGAVCLMIASKLRQCKSIHPEELVFFTDHSVTVHQVNVSNENINWERERERDKLKTWAQEESETFILFLLLFVSITWVCARWHIEWYSWIPWQEMIHCSQPWLVNVNCVLLFIPLLCYNFSSSFNFTHLHPYTGMGAFGFNYTQMGHVSGCFIGFFGSFTRSIAFDVRQTMQ